MSSIPAWVRRASGSRVLNQREGAVYIAQSPHWLAMAHEIDSGFHEHVLVAASNFSKTATDDALVPGAVLALQADGTLAEIAHWNSGTARIAKDLTETALSLDLAGRAPTEQDFVAIFRLIDRLGELTLTPPWWCGLMTRYAPWDKEIFQILDAGIVAAALDGPGGWQRVADLYEQGYQTTAPMLDALAAPAALSAGAL